MKVNTPKFKLLIVISFLWVMITILIVTSQSEYYWRFADYALPIFLITMPVWLFWSSYWIWPDKVSKFFYDKEKRLENNSDIKLKIETTKLKTAKDNLTLSPHLDDDKIREERRHQTNTDKIAIKRLIILCFINFMFAIYIGVLKQFVLRSRYFDYGSQAESFAALYVFTSGIFIAMAAPPIIIAAIMRILKRNPATTGLLILYYFIMFLWVYMQTDIALRLVSNLDIDMFARLTRGQTIDYILFATITTVIIFGVIVIMYKYWHKGSPPKKKFIS